MHLEDLGKLQAVRLAPLVGGVTATAQVPVVRVASNEWQITEIPQ